MDVVAQRGCCSWHDGIAYCDTSVGRYVCNDGTYSPTCECQYVNYNPPVMFYYTTSSPTKSIYNQPTTTPTFVRSKIKETKIQAKSLIPSKSVNSYYNESSDYDFEIMVMLLITGFLSTFIINLLRSTSSGNY